MLAALSQFLFGYFDSDGYGAAVGEYAARRAAALGQARQRGHRHQQHQQQ